MALGPFAKAGGNQSFTSEAQVTGLCNTHEHALLAIAHGNKAERSRARDGEKDRHK